MNLTYPGVAEITSRLQLFVWLVFFLSILTQLHGYILVFFIWFTYIRTCLRKSICEAEVDTESLSSLQSIWSIWEASEKVSEASGIELFTAEVSNWKLLTIDVEGFVLDVMWSFDLLLNMYLRFWNSGIFYQPTTPLCNLPRFWWHQQSIQHKNFPS